jgi:regulatory protein
MQLSLQPDECDPGKKWIVVDGQPWRSLNRSIWGRRPKIPNTLETEQALEAWWAKHELARAKNYALYRLSKQAYLSYDLRRLMNQKQVSGNVIDEVIDDLERIGYLDDEAWIGSFVKRRLAAKDGPNKISAALRNKRVPEQQIEAALSDDANHLDSITQLLATRYRSRDLSDYKEKQKVIAALMRKGFPYDAIKEALSI